MTRVEARNIWDTNIEEAFRFEQLMGYTPTYETPFRLFTWALDWAFGEELNDGEISLSDQMRMWERDELRIFRKRGWVGSRKGRQGLARMKNKVWTWAACTGKWGEWGSAGTRVWNRLIIKSARNGRPMSVFGRQFGFSKRSGAATRRGWRTYVVQAKGFVPRLTLRRCVCRGKPRPH
jgi:hypothetical protein